MNAGVEEARQFYTEEFGQYAKGSKISNVNQLAKLTRALGQNYTPTELSGMMKGGSLSLQEFLDVMQNKTVHQDTTESVLEALKIYDQNGSGSLEVSTLRFILLCQGDRLDNSQMESVMSMVPVQGGMFNYQEYLRTHPA